VRNKWSAALFVALVACRDHSAKKAADPPPDAAALADAAPVVDGKPLPAVETDWCTAGLVGLDAETCYLPPPPGDARSRKLLIYLHGIIPPKHVGSEQKENVMLAVRNASRRAGAAAIVPRGITGVGPRGSKDWWAWPTSPDAHAAHGPALVKRIIAAKAKLEEALGAPFAKTYLAGSSNGAYFAVNLALRDELPIDGLGAMSGGAPGAPIARKAPLPVYIGYGKFDEPSKGGALALAKAAEGAGWKTKIAEHPFPHGAKEIYVDEAFAFWETVP
jgi:predicted esterase